MEQNTDYDKLLSLMRDHNPEAYKAIYELNISAQFEFISSWTEGKHEKTSLQLTRLSRIYRQIYKQLGGDAYTFCFEVGKFCGYIETFENLLKKEQEILQIDCTLAELLSRGKPASKLVLRILFEAPEDNPWVPNSVLEKKCAQSPSALSNIMKRLVQAQAVDYYKEGRTVRYRLSPAGKRYYKEKIQSSLNMDVVKQLNRLIDQTDVMTGALFEMKQEISEQTHSINHIEYNLASYKRKESFDKQNSIGTLRIKDGTESKKSLLSFLSIPLKMSNYSYV